MKRETQNVVVAAGCREYGGPRPNYKIGESGVMVLCKACSAYMSLMENGAATATEPARTRTQKGVDTGVTTTQITTQKTTQRTAQKILEAIKANPNITRIALAREIQMSPDGIKWYLQKLRECNAIRRIGPKRGGHWEVVDGQ